MWLRMKLPTVLKTTKKCQGGAAARTPPVPDQLLLFIIRLGGSFVKFENLSVLQVSLL